MNLFKEKITLGKIGYLNVLPIYYPLETQIIKNPFKIVEGIPARLNELASKGELEISGTSSIEYARNFEKYLLIPNICIGSNGPVMSVLLLSKIPIQDLNGKEIVLSAHSHTSVALLKMYLTSRGIDVRYRTGNVVESIKHKDIFGALAIGDEALYLQRASNLPYILDLGEEWRRWTRLPFVFGVWVVNRETYRNRPHDIKLGCELLLRAKEWGNRRLDLFAKIVEQKNILSYEEAILYFEGLIYDMTENYLEGLKLFYSFLFNHNLIPKIPKIEFIF